MRSLCVINLGVLLLTLLAENSDAACSETNPCIEELGQGQPFKEPLQFDATKNDSIELSVDIQELQFGWLKLKRRVYNGDPTGPTWIVNKGQLLRVTVKNMLSDLNNEQTNKEENEMNRPNTTNVHTHGLHISSMEPQDSVLISILPGGQYEYIYSLHEEQPSGTYWYHAHVHGSTFLQVSSGMAGLIVVNDDYDQTPRQLWDVSCPEDCEADIQMIIQGILLFNNGFGSFSRTQEEIGDDGTFRQDNITTSGGNSLRSWLEENVGFMTVNGLLEPALTMKEDKMYRFRMVNSAGYDTVELLITNKGTNDSTDGCKIREIAYDGIYLDKPRKLHQGQSTLVPGNRVDWLVLCDKPGQYELRSYADEKNHPSLGNITRWSGLLVSLNVLSDSGHNGGSDDNGGSDHNGDGNHNGGWYHDGGGHHNGGWGDNGWWDHNGGSDHNGGGDHNGGWDHHDGWGHNGGGDHNGGWDHNSGGDHHDGWDHDGGWDHHDGLDRNGNGDHYNDWKRSGGWDHNGGRNRVNVLRTKGGSEHIGDRDADYDVDGHDDHHYRYRRSHLIREMLEAAKNKEHEAELKRFFDHYGWGQGGNHGSHQWWGEPGYGGGRNEEGHWGSPDYGEDHFDFNLPKRPFFVDDLSNEPEENFKERFVMEFDKSFQLGRESWSSADNYRYAMTVNEKQEWHVINTDHDRGHPFHPHINSFQVISYNNYTGPFGNQRDFTSQYVLYSQHDMKPCDFQRAGLVNLTEEPVPADALKFLGHDKRYNEDAGGYVRVGDWRDVLLIPPLANITIRFVPDRYTGRLIIHCHFLPHEDEGMMMIAKIVKKPAYPRGKDYLLANISSGDAFPGTCRKCDRYPFNNPKRLCDLDPTKINELLHNNVRSDSRSEEGKRRQYYPWKEGREGG